MHSPLASNPSRSAGFTLLEVLIAIVLTALIGLGANQIFNSAIRASHNTQERLEELSDLQKAMFHLSRDMQQLTARGIRNDFGDYEAALTTKTDFYKLEFTRTGWRNPLDDRRSELQRVAYELDEENQLMRHYWLVLDRAQDSEPRKRRLLKNVKDIELAFLSAGGRWSSDWPPDANPSGDDEEAKDPLAEFNQMPKAIRITIDHDQFGQIIRVFETTAYVDHEDIVVSNDSNDPNNPNDPNDPNNTGNQNDPNNPNNVNNNQGNQSGGGITGGESDESSR